MRSSYVQSKGKSRWISGFFLVAKAVLTIYLEPVSRFARRDRFLQTILQDAAEDSIADDAGWRECFAAGYRDARCLPSSRPSVMHMPMLTPEMGVT